MTRILLSETTLVGKSLLSIAQQIINAKQDVDRLKAIVTEIGVNNLEASAESLIPAGQATTINNGITQIQTALAGLSALVAVIDRG